MATYKITAPDGKTYRVSGEGTQEDALAAVKAKIGNMPEAPPSIADSAWDVAKSLPSGIARGLSYAAGLPGDANELIGQGIGAARDYLIGDVTPEQRAKADARRRERSILPTSENIRSTAHNITGVSLHQPETTAGKYASTIGEFLPAAFSPGSLLTKTARTVLPAVGSEASGQATEGTGYEPLARIGGALAGGLVTGGKSAVKKAGKGAPDAKQLKKNTDALYGQLRQSGIQYDPVAFNSTVVRAQSEMLKSGLRPSVAEGAFNYIDDLARQRGGIDFSDLDGVIQTVGDATRSASAAGNKPLAKAFGIIRDELDTFERSGELIGGYHLPRPQHTALVQTARRTALQNIKQRALKDILDNADTYASGVEAGIRNGIGNLLRSKKGRQLFKGAERQALLDVQHGRKSLRTLSRFGFDLFSWSGNASFLPTVGAIGAGNAFGVPAGVALAGLGSAAKIASPLLTKRAFDQAQSAIRSGALANAPQLQGYLKPGQSALTGGLIELRRQEDQRNAPRLQQQ